MGMMSLELYHPHSTNPLKITLVGSLEHSFRPTKIVLKDITRS